VLVFGGLMLWLALYEFRKPLLFELQSGGEKSSAGTAWFLNREI